MSSGRTAGIRKLGRTFKELFKITPRNFRLVFLDEFNPKKTRLRRRHSSPFSISELGDSPRQDCAAARTGFDSLFNFEPRAFHFLQSAVPVAPFMIAAGDGAVLGLNDGRIADVLENSRILRIDRQ